MMAGTKMKWINCSNSRRLDCEIAAHGQVPTDLRSRTCLVPFVVVVATIKRELLKKIEVQAHGADCATFDWCELQAVSKAPVIFRPYLLQSNHGPAKTIEVTRSPQSNKGPRQRAAVVVPPIRTAKSLISAFGLLYSVLMRLLESRKGVTLPGIQTQTASNTAVAHQAQHQARLPQKKCLETLSGQLVLRSSGQHAKLAAAVRAG
jgi:hypothetical protein